MFSIRINGNEKLALSEVEWIQYIKTDALLWRDSIQRYSVYTYYIGLTMNINPLVRLSYITVTYSGDRCIEIAMQPNEVLAFSQHNETVDACRSAVIKENKRVT